MNFFCNLLYLKTDEKFKIYENCQFIKLGNKVGFLYIYLIENAYPVGSDSSSCHFANICIKVWPQTW